MADFFLCYECGTTFSARNDFDEHILVHQAVSLCYQIYEFDKGGPPIAKAKVENQHVSSAKECYKPQAVKLSATFRRTPSDCSHRNARKTTTKRKLTDHALSLDSSKLSCSKQRKSSQNDVKIMKLNKTPDSSTVNASDTSQAINAQMDKEFSKRLDEPGHTRETSSADALVTSLSAGVSGDLHIDLSVREVTNAPKVIEQSKTDVSIATAATSAGVTVPSSPSIAPTTSTTTTALPKCLNCDYRSRQGTDMVEHVVRVHKTSITSLERMDFVDGKWSEAVKLEPRQRCLSTFWMSDNDTEEIVLSCGNNFSSVFIVPGRSAK